MFVVLVSCLLLLVPDISYAFLPPEFFVQGLTSIWIVLAGGVAVALAPFVLLYHFIKQFFQKNRKLILLLILQNIVLALVLGTVFYYQYYKPLYEDSYLFPQKTIGEKILDPTELNKNYNYLGDVLRDDRAAVKNLEFGITIKEIEERQEKGERIYFIDVREIEEYEVGHVVGAKHFRYIDLTLKDIRELFPMSDEEFQSSLFVVYCHNGDRGFFASQKFQQDNIKYLLGGVEEGLYQSKFKDYTGVWLSDKKIFGKKYQQKFQSKVEDVIPLIENGAFIIDGRNFSVSRKKHIKGSLLMKIGITYKDDYEEAIDTIIQNKEKNFVLIAERYSDLFYLNLLILRLERDYGFIDNQFHIVFHQFSEFENYPSIEFSGTEV